MLNFTAGVNATFKGQTNYPSKHLPDYLIYSPEDNVRETPATRDNQVLKALLKALKENSKCLANAPTRSNGLMVTFPDSKPFFNFMLNTLGKEILNLLPAESRDGGISLVSKPDSLEFKTGDDRFYRTSAQDEI